MELIKSLLKSITIQNLKVAFYIWMFNFVTSITLFYFLYQFVSAFTEKSIISNRFGSQDCLEILIDIFHTNSPSLTILSTFVFIVFLVFGFISIFISAGIYSVFANEEKATFKNLFSFSVANFFKFLKIFLINLINFSLAVFASGFLLYLILKMRDQIGNAILVQLIFYLWIIITALIMIFATAVYDFSRIIKIKHERNILFCFRKGLAFVWSRKVSMLVIFTTIIALTGALHLLFSIMLNQIENRLPVYIMVFVYQIFIILKYYLKAILMNTEVNLMAFSSEAE